MVTYEIKDMHGRPVLVRRLEEWERFNPATRKCADCGVDATVRIFELSAPVRDAKWSWCGHCDIGG